MTAVSTLPSIMYGYRSLLRFRNAKIFRRRRWLEVGTAMEAPIGCHAEGREGSKQKPAPSKYQRAQSPWLSRACNRAIIAWLRLSLRGAGACACAGDLVIRYHL